MLFDYIKTKKGSVSDQEIALRIAEALEQTTGATNSRFPVFCSELTLTIEIDKANNKILVDRTSAELDELGYKAGASIYLVGQELQDYYVGAKNNAGYYVIESVENGALVIKADTLAVAEVIDTNPLLFLVNTPNTMYNTILAIINNNISAEDREDVESESIRNRSIKYGGSAGASGLPKRLSMKLRPYRKLPSNRNKELCRMLSSIVYK